MENLHHQEPTSDELWNVAKSCAHEDFLETNSIMKNLGSHEPVIEWNPSVGSLSNPLLKNTLDWWNETRKDNLFPKPGDVDPIGLKPMLGKITLYDVINNGENFKCRLYGSHLVPEVGRDLTGLLLTDIWTPLKTFFMINFRSILIRKEPLYTIHQPHHSLQLARWERLIVPLGTDGEIERLLTVLIATPPENEV